MTGFTGTSRCPARRRTRRRLVAMNDEEITFDDFEDDPDDNDALEAYAEELAEAAKAFGVPVPE